MPSETTKPWRVHEDEFPGMVPIRTQLRFLLRYAILAPSFRNTQPWRFELAGNVVHLFADRSRQQAIADPTARELYLSLGCALENLLAAAEHFGFRHDVTYCPWSVEGPAASVAFTHGGQRSAARAGITLEAIVRRHNDNGRHLPAPVPDEVRARLAACCVEPDLRLYLTDDHFFRRWVDELTLEADRLEFASPAYRDELGDWIGRGTLGAPLVVSKLTRLAVKHLDLGEAVAAVDQNRLKSAPLLGIVGSTDDDPGSQLRSGQLFERVWLTATGMGLSVHPLSSILQVPGLRKALAELLPEAKVVPQHLFRLGYTPTNRAEPRHTPRREVDEVVAPADQ